MDKASEIGCVHVHPWETNCSVILRKNRLLLSMGIMSGHDQFVRRAEGLKAILNDNDELANWHWQFVSEEPKAQMGVYASFPFDRHHQNQESPIDFLRRVTGLPIDEAEGSRLCACHD